MRLEIGIDPVSSLRCRRRTYHQASLAAKLMCDGTSYATTGSGYQGNPVLTAG
ncbi:hypothetical protein GCM10008094_08560 [Aidingimonas halophila]|nr:hypothetical protein GCM10008094_08560 [Aidingimonas halophila]